MFTSIERAHITARPDQSTPYSGPHKIISLFKLAKSGVTIFAAKRKAVVFECVHTHLHFFFLYECVDAPAFVVSL